MARDTRKLEQDITELLTQPAAAPEALAEALSALWQEYQGLLERMERITRVSDAYQSMARQRELSLTERFDKQLRQLEKVARISDRYQKMMRELNLALKEAATQDPLTSLFNRRPLLERLKAGVEQADQTGEPFAVVMLDLDGFKQINDHYGHDAGDAVLVEVARVMEDEMRPGDLCGRWGGEEFLLLLQGADSAVAIGVAEQVRQAMAGVRVRVGNEVISVTASAGVARYQAGEGYAAWLSRADQALLQAKRAGRNRLCCAD